MNISIREGHVLTELKKIPDNSIDCICTSPPYYGLRNYNASNVIWDDNPECDHAWNEPENETDSNYCMNCNAWKGELGQEPSYKLYIMHLLQVTQELKRVLKPTGTMFWNIADSYSGSGGWGGQTGLKESTDPSKMYVEEGAYPDSPPSKDNDIPRKSQMMIPERFAIALIDEQGWIKRNTLVWYKRSSMPASVTDRFSNKWEPVFFFTKSREYWFDLDAVRKPLSQSTIRRIMQPGIEGQFQKGKVADFGKETQTGDMKKTLLNLRDKMQKGARFYGENWNHSGYLKEDGTPLVNPNGANPGDVLDITTQSHSFSHFAVFPVTLVEPMIKSGCAKEVCSKCGKPKMPEREKTGRTYDSRNGESREPEDGSSRKIVKAQGVSSSSVFNTETIQETRTIFKPSCKCNAQFIRGTVLDPFGGSGTTGVVAKKEGRTAIMIEMVPEYVEIMRKRLEMNEGDVDAEFQEILGNDDLEVDE